MYPNNMAVRINDEEHDLAGTAAFVLNNAKDGETTNGEPIPDGWVEVVFDPMNANGYHTELFRESNVEICGC